MKKPSSESNGGRVVILTVLGLLVLVAVGYAAAYAGAGAKVPRATTVAGIDIGGKERGDAIAALEKGLAERDSIQVTVDGKAASAIGAEKAGITVDTAATVEQAGSGKSWSPSRLWNYYTGGDEVEPVIDVDEDALSAALDELNKKVGTEPKEGRVAFRRGEAVTIAGKSGEGVDPDAARDALVRAAVWGESAELELVEIKPEIDETDVQDALNEFANPATSGPVTLVFDKHKVVLTPEEFTPVLSMKAADGKLAPELDEKKLSKLVRSKFAEDMGQPVDATVKLVDGKPKVIPGKPGVDYDQKDINEAFLALVSKESGRQVKVPSKVVKPKFTTADAKKLGIVEEVSSFSTYYPHAEYRNVNLGRAGELIDGTVLKPGETFSLNDIVGERTAANGFVEGYIISNGILKKDYGGGVSQMATTVFNAMFFAGYEDVEHRPHSFYIDRYPVGREATVVWGALDLAFKNDTEHGVLIDVEVNKSGPGGQGEVKVTMYSTEVWDITSSTGDRYNFTSPKTRELTTDDCEPNAGYGGFDIDVWRYFHKPGSSKVEKSEKFHTTYTPSDKVVCK
ncbi:vancomycin resistance protein YoaR [Nocardioides daedukensis]|uniref:Vancomycin resistance protein YoaR n=1 Tax=Nocardioides daedukensis TaxID=634462 RepID=A0A7Y9S4J0_9ACTN|nr:vancomycin resistance protein YoaR [Nocardioides daedukensis]